MSILLRPVVGAFLLIVPTLALAQSAPSPSPAPASPTSQPSTGADAKAEDAQPADRRALAACRTDATTLCKDAAKGGRIACLRQNTAKLSPGCTTALADLDAKTKALREACAEDVKANCATGAKGRAVVQCLRESRSKLSPACGAAFEARYAKQ
jgi:hypothetical protein